MNLEPLESNSLSISFIDHLYGEYLKNASSVAPEWRTYFDGVNGSSAPTEGEAAAGEGQVVLRLRMGWLAHNFRLHGHRVAAIDPLGSQRSPVPELDPGFYGLSDPDLEQRLDWPALGSGDSFTVREIIAALRETYCGSIGVEFMHIDDDAVRRWLIERMEPCRNRIDLDAGTRVRILTRLTEAQSFEEFIRRKFLGAKTFSLEGSESLIPLIDLAIGRAAAAGVREIVFGMAHRGRLNVLANVVGKSAADIFREFADIDAEAFVGRGDVKYHLGHSSDYVTPEGTRVHLSLCFNPSHLEFIVPVALGRIRAKQDRSGDRERRLGLPFLIHGDASFSGEGVIQESLNLSGLNGYRVGGALHVIVNNQLGFTTSPGAGRSSPYASDVAKIISIPILHVNGEDLDAVAQATALAVDFRQTFGRDIVIDLYGYRRLGHNETDEPKFTQPLLYRAIEQRKPVRALYLDRLIRSGLVKAEEAEKMSARVREHWEQQFSRLHSSVPLPPTDTLQGMWAGYHGGQAPEEESAKTGIEKNRSVALLEALTHLPADFHPHAKIAQLLDVRRAMARGERPLDWSAAEALAFASVASDGVRIRLSGQDSGRGTFSQRHAVLHDVENGKTYLPLAHVAPNQAPVEVFDSPLSETAVLGFDYGFSLDYPDALVLWEAQFGDFANAAQVIIDQFIASAEAKWRRLSGLVLLLPHGWEGMGPEHSSARLERFLQLAASNNMRVVVPTTPAQYFHCLRRQALSRSRKPLIVFTPKSLLRHPRVVSNLEACAQGTFERLIADPGRADAKRVILSSGKIYYDLEARRAELRRDDIAMIRLEELYPLPAKELENAIAPFAPGTPAFWVQEEPENMGAWRYLCATLGPQLFGRLPLSLIARPESPSPATGSAASHRLEQERLIKRAMGEGSSDE